jgi:hypothetical protein
MHTYTHVTNAYLFINCVSAELCYLTLLPTSQHLTKIHLFCLVTPYQLQILKSVDSAHSTEPWMTKWLGRMIYGGRGNKNSSMSRARTKPVTIISRTEISITSRWRTYPHTYWRLFQGGKATRGWRWSHSLSSCAWAWNLSTETILPLFANKLLLPI